jgi:type VI secretion system protein ImpJ
MTTHASRVVWQEGMHLVQHHFQTQSRYFEDAIHFALSHLFYKPYGLGGYALDAEALRNGTVSLVHARGVLPDGLAFHIPESDPPPAPRDIREIFSPTQESHVVLLAIPAYRRTGSNCTSADGNGGGATRYVSAALTVPDEITGRDERRVDVGRKNFRLALDVELTEGEVTLPLARVRRDGTGHFVFDPSFIPPLLQIGASPQLMELLHRLIEMLDAKGDSMAGAAAG